MKTYSTALKAALATGEVICVGAVKIATAVDPALVWSGHGPIELDGETYKGIGQAGLISATGGQLGAAAHSIELSLSGVEPETLALLGQLDVKRAPVVIWRLFFNGTGSTLLDAHVFARGRIDGMPIERTPGGPATIMARVETAARGLGRQTGRLRSDADQRLVAEDDGGFRWITQAPSRQVAWGGKPPSHARGLLPNVGGVGAGSRPGGLVGQVIDKLF